MPQTFSKQSLPQVIALALGCEAQALKITPLKIGLSYKILYTVQYQAETFVLHLASADARPRLFYEAGLLQQMPALHTLVRAQTLIPLPEVVVTDFSRQNLDRDFLITRGLPGKPLAAVTTLNHRLYNQMLMKLGVYLKALHALTEVTFGYQSPHQPFPPQNGWGDTFDLLWTGIVEDIVACGLYTEVEAETMNGLWQTYRPAFDHTVTPCLLWANNWKSHTLIAADGQVSGLFALDEAFWGDPEFDFAVLDNQGIYGAPFWEGYGGARPTDAESQTRRRFYLIYELQRCLVREAWHANDYAEAENYKQTVMTLASRLTS